jgi:hypothetical protein
MDSSTDFPRLEKLLRLLKFLEGHPYSGLREIVDGCDISQATFYRLVHAAEGLGVRIEFGTVYPCNPSKTRSGYRIKDYGAINKRFLKGNYHE